MFNENPEDLGMPEWRTWAIVDLEWWTATAEDQRRSEFTGKHNDGKGIGKGAVSDPDEWDDWELNGDPDALSRWNGHLITPSIKIKGAAEKSLVLTLDSSWRPEDTQDGEITVSFDGGKEEQILLFKSVGIDAGAHTLVTIPTLKLDDLRNIERWLEQICEVKKVFACNHYRTSRNNRSKPYRIHSVRLRTLSGIIIIKH